MLERGVLKYPEIHPMEFSDFVRMKFGQNSMNMPKNEPTVHPKVIFLDSPTIGASNGGGSCGMKSPWASCRKWPRWVTRGCAMEKNREICPNCMLPKFCGREGAINTRKLFPCEYWAEMAENNAENAFPRVAFIVGGLKI